MIALRCLLFRPAFLISDVSPLPLSRGERAQKRGRCLFNVTPYVMFCCRRSPGFPRFRDETGWLLEACHDSLEFGDVSVQISDSLDLDYSLHGHRHSGRWIPWRFSVTLSSCTEVYLNLNHQPPLPERVTTPCFTTTM